jgi:hypothetical protein
MAQVSSPHIWYPSGYPGTAYDLRTILDWVAVTGSNVRVRFQNAPDAPVIFNQAAFEAAKQASLSAE